MQWRSGEILVFITSINILFKKKMPVIVKQKEETLFPNGNMHLREMNTDRT